MVLIYVGGPSGVLLANVLASINVEWNPTYSEFELGLSKLTR